MTFDTAKLIHIVDCVLDGQDEVIVRDAVDEIVRRRLSERQALAIADERSKENVGLAAEVARLQSAVSLYAEGSAKLTAENEKLRAAPRPVLLSEEEAHAIGHATWQVDRATPESPEVSFDYELVICLLGLLKRLGALVDEQRGTGDEPS